MSNNNDQTLQNLQTIGLGKDEAVLYLQLLGGPATYLELSRTTGINRTKIYRLATQLERRGLAARKVDGSGTMLMALSPSLLEMEIVAHEETVETQRASFSLLLPKLEHIYMGRPQMTVCMYNGEEGFKQMLWHELKAKDRLMTLGGGMLEELIRSKRWANDHRERTADSGYEIYELTNRSRAYANSINDKRYLAHYYCRSIPRSTLLLNQQITIYNDTVALYEYHMQPKRGVEIIDASYASMMRQIFDNYWQIAGEQM